MKIHNSESDLGKSVSHDNFAAITVNQPNWLGSQ